MLKLVRRLRYWMHQRRASRELVEEIEFHRILRQREFEKSGFSTEQAETASRRALGNALIAGEDARSVWIWPWLEQLWRDVRYGGRTLWRSPVYTVTVLLTLALGIGANTAVFSVANAVLLKPLPYRDAERLVMVWERNRETGKERDPVAPLNFQDWQRETAVFETVAAYEYTGFVLTGAGEPERIGALSVSASFFETLGAGAAVGRTFTVDEERKRDRALVLSHDFWQRRFGGDRSLIGNTLRLGSNSFVVVGVMPPQFRFPDNAPPVEVYSPLILNAQFDFRARDLHTLAVIARLKDGVSIERATVHMNQVARRIADVAPESNPEVAMFGIHDIFVENVRLGLLVIAGIVAFLLILVSANVANLKLARGMARGREIAVRTSLGATRGRIVRQLVTESLLLSMVGGAGGLLLAWSATGIFRRLSPDSFGMDNVALDMRVMAFTLAVSIGTGIVFGLLPAWQISRANLSETIKARGTAGRRTAARSLLVIAEVTLSIVLVISAGLMVRSLVNLRALDYGFRPENLFTMQLFVAGARYPADPGQFRPRQPGAPDSQLSAQARLFNDLVDRLKSVPGVQNAAAVSALPLNPVGIDFDLPVYVDGQPRPLAGEAPQADFRIATSDYFETMGIPVLQGRGFAETDGVNTSDVIVINDVMARRIFAGERPIGRRLILYGRPREIVGVVGAVRHRGFRVEPNAEMIVPSKQFQQFGGMTIVLRSALDTGSLETVVKRELRQIDPDLAVYNARTMERFLGDSVAQPQFTTLLLASFALFGIVLASVGLYGVVSYGVTQRTPEIGIRMALGAQRHSVIGMFLRETLALFIVGVACGLGAAFGFTRLMRGLLFGVAPSDPVTYIVSVVALMLAALMATYRPALRATRVEPVRALRHD